MSTLEFGAPWIEPAQQSATAEPTFSLAEMFSGAAAALKPEPPEKRLRAPKLMKRAFTLKGDVAKATLCMTARGTYLTYMNGSLVSDALFAPDYTSYDKLLMYQTYDVTPLVRAGENIWAVTLADGWYAGRIATSGASIQYGDRLSIAGELVVEYADGTSEVVGTDDAWRSTTGKYVYSDIQIGEKQDLRLANDDWVANANVDGWDEVAPVAAPKASLVAQKGPQVTRHERLTAVSHWDEDGKIVVDFGQIIAGRCVLECDLAEGQEIRLEHAEVLDAEGKFFMNIVGRNKDAVDVFIGRGQHEVLEPDFTFHGFRYVRISGWEGDFDPACITAVALYSDMPVAGSISTSDARVNQLLSNVVWGQRGNMLSIPTDCPQRERMGWTGDIQVYAPTGCYFQNLKSFLERWLDQVVADQLPTGEVYDYSPKTGDEDGGFTGSISSAGWGDAIVLVPWALYREYGDVADLERYYEPMRKWHEFCKQSAAGDKEGSARFIWDTKFHYGDWMLPSALMCENPDPIGAAKETAPLVATAYLAYVADALARISDVLGNADDAAEERAYAQDVRAAFVERFYEGNGVLNIEYQGMYVLALAFDMLPEAEREAVAKHLAQMVENNGKRLDTGFLAMPHLLDTLDRFGYADLAYDVFWQDQCPSWLYEVDHGATTIWENWANVAPDGTVGTFSFNHYSFGCVADWIVRKVGGLLLREPGYREFDVAPAFVRGFDSAELEHECTFGSIKLAWESVDGGHKVSLTVPEGATAHVMLPGAEPQDCTAGSYEFTCA